MPGYNVFKLQDNLESTWEDVVASLWFIASAEEDCVRLHMVIIVSAALETMERQLLGFHIA